MLGKFPQIIHNDVHWATVVEFLLKLYTLPSHLNTYEHMQQTDNYLEMEQHVKDNQLCVHLTINPKNFIHLLSVWMSEE